MLTSGENNQKQPCPPPCQCAVLRALRCPAEFATFCRRKPWQRIGTSGGPLGKRGVVHYHRSNHSTTTHPRALHQPPSVVRSWIYHISGGSWRRLARYPAGLPVSSDIWRALARRVRAPPLRCGRSPPCPAPSTRPRSRSNHVSSYRTDAHRTKDPRTSTWVPSGLCHLKRMFRPPRSLAPTPAEARRGGGGGGRGGRLGEGSGGWHHGR